MNDVTGIAILAYLLVLLFCLALMIAPAVIIPLVILAHQKKRKKQNSVEWIDDPKK